MTTPWPDFILLGLSRNHSFFSTFCSMITTRCLYADRTGNCSVKCASLTQKEKEDFPLVCVEHLYTPLQTPKSHFSLSITLAITLLGDILVCCFCFCSRPRFFTIILLLLNFSPNFHPARGSLLGAAGCQHRDQRLGFRLNHMDADTHTYSHKWIYKHKGTYRNRKMQKEE